MQPLDGAVRWGIAGTGNIAASFAEAFANIEGGEIVAVGSRTREAAGAFASTHRIARAHGSYEELAADPTVDAVYVAGIHPVHMEQTVMFHEAGKHVLVEKPIALNAAQTDRMIAAAEANDRFLMEAMWMRFNPAHVAAVERVEAGDIGEVRRVRADFSFAVPMDPDHRLWSNAKGGGALLDVGIYPFTLAWWLLGEPEAVSQAGEVGATGVDTEIAVLCRWASGASALLSAAINLPGDMTARIEGTDGSISFPAPAHACSQFTIQRSSGIETIEVGPASLHHQVTEVHRCLAAGQPESPRMPWATSRAMMARFDAIRAELGVRYPAD